MRYARSFVVSGGCAGALLLRLVRGSGIVQPGGTKALSKETGFAHVFYTGRAWRRCRRTYVQQAAGLCERCLAKGLYEPGTEVHHKIRLTPDNINDPSVALNPQNL